MSRSITNGYHILIESSLNVVEDTLRVSYIYLDANYVTSGSITEWSGMAYDVPNSVFASDESTLNITNPSDVSYTGSCHTSSISTSCDTIDNEFLSVSLQISADEHKFSYVNSLGDVITKNARSNIDGTGIVKFIFDKTTGMVGSVQLSDGMNPLVKISSSNSSLIYTVKDGVYVDDDTSNPIFEVYRGIYAHMYANVLHIEIQTRLIVGATYV